MATNLGTALKDLYSLEEHFGMRSSMNNGLLDIIDELRLGNGINEQMQINDGETAGDWTEETAAGGAGTGYFDVTADTTNERIGTSGMLLTATTGYDAVTEYMITTDYINGSAVPGKNLQGEKVIDLRRYDYLGMWNFGIATGGFGTASELEIAIKDLTSGTATWSSGIDVNVAPTDDVHKRFEIDITTLTREKVSHIGFINKNANAAEAIMVDEIVAYKFGNGWGPVGGPCLFLPIQSAVTLTKGNIAQYTVSTVHRLDAADANSTTVIGPVVIGGTGNAAGTVMGCVQAYGPAYLQANAATTAGEGQQFVAGNLIADGATGEIEECFAKALEAAGAQYDVIACYLVQGLIEV
ncbi:hypothetical protein H8E77_24960 [bacterium]|nr:hypothetical protein [bacterium]